MLQGWGALPGWVLLEGLLGQIRMWGRPPPEFRALKQALRQLWRSIAGSASLPVSGVYVRLRASWFRIGGEVAVRRTTGWFILVQRWWCGDFASERSDINMFGAKTTITARRRRAFVRLRMACTSCWTYFSQRWCGSAYPLPGVFDFCGNMDVAKSMPSPEMCWRSLARESMDSQAPR